MRALLAAALLLLTAGVATLAYAASLGQVAFALVLVFPVIVGTGPWGFLGGLLIIAGLSAAFASFAQRAAGPAPAAESHPPAATEPRTGGFILVGPIPIAFGSTRALAYTMLVLALIALALFVLLPLLLPLLLGARP